MPLTQIAKRVPKKEPRPNVVIDLAAYLPEGDEDTKVIFREPRSQDLFASAARKKRLKLKRPHFNDQLISQILLLASCYVPTKADEAGVNLDDMMLTIAENDMEMFLHIVAKHAEAFPLEKMVNPDEVGNDSPQTNNDTSSPASTD